MKMEGRRCLVAGAGYVGLTKIQGLLDCQAAVTVVSPRVVSEIEELATDGRINLRLREYCEADLNSMQVVIASTDKPEVNHLIYQQATGRGLFVNVVDDPDYCDFYFGSIVRRGALQVAISTRGESPAFAQRLKEEIDEALPADTASWLDRLGELRRHVNRVVESGPRRTSLLRELARRETCDPATCPCLSLTART
ncbi:MAG TPA: bifunctional precorrin-2 dehydrogenase/sirohydrochlorin ferrochelatase [Bryobacteraceae bacterium]|nr:bifunctional precorrin-2 dehydrogenase/sirohydrochlorin ferrochelatase [Bryobacteraceae bacterium]